MGRHVVDGYLKAIVVFMCGSLLLSIFTLRGNWSYITPWITMLFWLTVFIGGFSAGTSAQRRGFKHGITVGFALWVTWWVTVTWFLPDLLHLKGIITSFIHCVFWGAVGGVSGVNIANIPRKEYVFVKSKNI